MATVGKELTSPESGWQRIDGKNSLITYSPSKYSWSDATFWAGTGTATPDNRNGEGYFAFNFTGSSGLRLIAYKGPGNTTENNLSIYLDGVKIADQSQYSNPSIPQCLILDLTGLSTGEHYVKIQRLPTTTGTYNGMNLDAIDIDSTGTLKAYNETPTGVDDANTVSLLHFNGGIVDESGKVWTAYGGPTITAEGKFSSGLLFNGAQYINCSHADFSFPGKDFTVECFVKVDSSTDTYVPIQHAVTDFSSNVGWQLDIINGQAVLYIAGIGLSTYSTSIVGAKTHIAVIRAGDLLKLFVGGVLVSSDAFSFNQSTYAMMLNFGAPKNAASSYPMMGMLDEIRISNIARYTTNFTPPTAPFGSTKFQFISGGM